jgi:glutamate formiminotransferase/formiminotetrahydrofolate cyclodeaminase
MYDESTTIRQFLDATAARQPTPGGGSVTALCAALAASLGEMVINYSVGKKGLEPFEGELKPALAEFNRARKLLTQLMAEDQQAYAALTAARKLPESVPDRAAQCAAALTACIRGPQAMGATAVAVLELCDRVVNFVNPWLLSDLAVCADLSMAAVRCAAYNVRVNVGEVSDEAERQRIEATTFELLSRAGNLIRQVSPRIWARHEQPGA